MKLINWQLKSSCKNVQTCPCNLGLSEALEQFWLDAIPYTDNDLYRFHLELIMGYIGPFFN